jgi:type II secretory pathway component PulJ
VELLVALTISSLIILPVVSGFGLGFRLWRSIEDRRPAQEASRRVFGALRRELACVYVPPVPEKAAPPFLRGGSTKLSFFTSCPGYYYGAPAGRCAQITYEFKDGALTRTEQLAATEKVIGQPTTAVVAEGLSGLSFLYPDPAGSGKKGASTGDTNRPPKLVQVRLEWPTASFVDQFLVAVREALVSDEQ